MYYTNTFKINHYYNITIFEKSNRNDYTVKIIETNNPYDSITVDIIRSTNDNYYKKGSIGIWYNGWCTNIEDITGSPELLAMML